MLQKKLGKGLSDLGITELLSDFNNTTNSVSTNSTPAADKDLQRLPIQQLTPGRLQPRQHFDEAALNELAESIRSQGIIQPIIVRPLSSDLYEIVAGERRWRAAQIAGLKQVPVIIRKMNDQDAIAIALIENIQRRDLNVLEEAHALQRLLEEFQLTHQEIATAVGKSRTAITNLLRLLNLDPAVKNLLATDQLEMGHARALLPLSAEKQQHIAQQIVHQHLSVRAAEELVRKQMANPAENLSLSANASPLISVDADIEHLLHRLAQKFNTKVLVKPQAKGNGKLIIHYKSLLKLRSILDGMEL